MPVRHVFGIDVRCPFVPLYSCGSRRKEIGGVEFRDVFQRETGDWFLRVSEDYAKRSQFRETPIPERFAYKIQATVDANSGLSKNDVVVLEHSMRTVRRHLQEAVSELVADDNRDYGCMYGSTVIG